ncbi:hypothetical protein GDO81_022475 [Engystomops pustulosus]|uniref:Epoxide hydrolase N-terminal domain-containing protein n=1 Tax=Engystomops pustulosus TaxID=76066 RepID=A0AAV6YR30_ENGPU|nr:hypothetical protein GDO81_022475 [Engystomops pustulosus]
MLFEILAALIVGVLLYCYLFRAKDETLPMGDGWWGAGPRREDEDEEIHPFKIETSEEELKDLFRRIDDTRYAEPLEGSRFNYGFNSKHLRKVVSYWKEGFSWKKQLEVLNQFPHFKTKIEECDPGIYHPLLIEGGATNVTMQPLFGIVPGEMCN